MRFVKYSFLLIVVLGILSLCCFVPKTIESTSKKLLTSYGFSEPKFNVSVRPVGVTFSDISTKYSDKADITAKKIDVSYSVKNKAVDKIEIESLNVNTGRDFFSIIPALIPQGNNAGATLINNIKIIDTKISLRDKKDSYFYVKEAIIENGKDSDFTLEVKNFPSDLLNIYLKEKNIFMTGDFSGEIPVSYKNGEFIIKQANLKSTHNGVFQYTGGDGLFGSGELENINTLLKNFNYKEMNVKIDGSTESNIKINLFIKGNNPEFYSGKDVELNINLDGNIIPAIKSSLETFNFDQQAIEKLQK